jgi:hypothetical protein
MAAPVEAKVQAATSAAAASGLALWLLGHYVFKAGVPDVVASWIYVIVPAAITFAAGYLAKHTGRPAVRTIGTGGGGGGGEFAVTPQAHRPPEKTLIPPAAPE